MSSTRKAERRAEIAKIKSEVRLAFEAGKSKHAHPYKDMSQWQWEQEWDRLQREKLAGLQDARNHTIWQAIGLIAIARDNAINKQYRDKCDDVISRLKTLAEDLDK